MRRLSGFFIVVFLHFISESTVTGSEPLVAGSVTSIRDTIPDEQLLFNGRVWRSLYSNTVGDEFLFSKEWLIGDVNINEIEFHNVLLKYDILNDQLLASYNKVTIVQLNKELIREFKLSHDNRKDTFQNFSGGNDNTVNGFGQVLYKGNIYLILKNIKRIQQLAFDNKYDEFYQQQAVYILKGDRFYKVKGKKELLEILSDRKQQIQTYIRENKIKIRKNAPESFIPVVKFYDTFKDAA